MKEKLAEMQKKIDEIIEHEGITDEVIDLQVELNSLRHEHNIPDSDKFIFEEYVQ